MNYKKSYIELIIISIIFIGVCILVSLYPLNESIMMLKISNLLNIYTLILMYVMYKKQRIYWINGVSYEEALHASEESRKAYAYKHLKRFFIWFIIYFIYTFIAYYFNLRYFFNIGFELIGICIIAFSTMNIHLE